MFDSCWVIDTSKVSIVENWYVREHRLSLPTFSRGKLASNTGTTCSREGKVMLKPVTALTVGCAAQAAWDMMDCLEIALLFFRIFALPVVE